MYVRVKTFPISERFGIIIMKKIGIGFTEKVEVKIIIFSLSVVTSSEFRP